VYRNRTTVAVKPYSLHSHIFSCFESCWGDLDIWKGEVFREDQGEAKGIISIIGSSGFQLPSLGKRKTVFYSFCDKMCKGLGMQLLRVSQYSCRKL